MSGRAVIVTGASSHCGRACARRFASAGDRLILTDHEDPTLHEFVDTLRATGADVQLLCGDIADRLHVHNIIAETKESYDRVDVLVHTAIVPSQIDFFEMTEESFVETLKANLTGCFLINQAFAKQVSKQERDPLGRGNVPSLVNVGSLEALRLKGGDCAFTAANSGLLGLTKSVASALSVYGGRANAVVAPHPALFPLADDEGGSVETEARAVAESVYHLTSDEIGAISGQVVFLENAAPLPVGIGQDRPDH